MTIEQPPPEREIPPEPPSEEPRVPPEMPPHEEPEWRAPGGPEITDPPMRLPSDNPDVETEL